MTHPLWLPTVSNAVNDPADPNHIPVPVNALFSRLNALYQRQAPLAAELLQRALNLKEAENVDGAVTVYAQLFKKVPAAAWADGFDELVNITVEQLTDHLAAYAPNGDLWAWGCGRALRCTDQGLSSASLFKHGKARLPHDLNDQDFGTHDTTAWLWLKSDALEQTVKTLWERASYVPASSPASPSPKGRGRKRRITAPTLIGDLGLTSRMVTNMRSRLGDDLNDDLQDSEDNLWEMRNRLRAGVNEAADKPATSLFSMAYTILLARRESWTTAKEQEQARQEDLLVIDPMVDALNRGLFGGDHHEDDDDIALNDDDEDDDEDNEMLNEDPVELDPRMVRLMQANANLNVHDLAGLLEQVLNDDDDEPIPRPHRLRRRQARPRDVLPDTMPMTWNLTEWPLEAQRFQLAFEKSLADAVRGLRGVYVERLVDWVEQNDGGPTWKLGQRLWGNRFTLNEFNRLAPSRAIAERLITESPRLGVFALRVAPLMGIDRIDLDTLGHVKKTLRARGVTDAVWKKTIRDLPANWMLDAWAERLRFEECPIADLALNLLSWQDKGHLLRDDLTTMAQLLKDPESPIAQALIETLDPIHRPRSSDEDDDDQDDDADDELSSEALDQQSVLRTALHLAEQKERHARLPSLVKAIVGRLRDTTVANFFANEWPLVNDYLARSEPGTWATFPEKMTWPMLWRRQQAWHETVLQAEKGKHYRYRWTSALPTFSNGEFTALPLENGGDLWEEGKVMHHCVSSYAQDCKRGTHRIFSIRKGEQRVGTLELRRSRSQAWSIGQFNGYCNHAVKVPGAKAFAKLVRAAYMHAEINLTTTPTSAPSEPSPSLPLSSDSQSDAASLAEVQEWLAMFKTDSSKPSPDGDASAGPHP